MFTPCQSEVRKPETDHTLSWQHMKPPLPLPSTQQKNSLHGILHPLLTATNTPPWLFPSQESPSKISNLEVKRNFLFSQDAELICPAPAMAVGNRSRETHIQHIPECASDRHNSFCLGVGQKDSTASDHSFQAISHSLDENEDRNWPSPRLEAPFSITSSPNHILSGVPSGKINHNSHANKVHTPTFGFDIRTFSWCRRFQCHQCRQSFTRKSDLKRHREIHKLLKKFPCPNCQKRFSRKDVVKRHIKTMACDDK